MADTTITATLTDSNNVISIVTIPAVTSGTLTVHPARVTTTLTTIITKTTKSKTNTRTTATVVKTAGCVAAAPKKDSPKHKGVKRSDFIAKDERRKRALAKRDGPDGPLTTTITEITSIALTTSSPLYSCVYSSYSSSDDNHQYQHRVHNDDNFHVCHFNKLADFRTTTQTVFSGTVAHVVTAPTPTRTVTTRLFVTVTNLVTVTEKYYPEMSWLIL